MGLESDWQEIVETSYAVVDQQIDPFFFDKVAENLGIKRDYKVNKSSSGVLGLRIFLLVTVLSFRVVIGTKQIGSNQFHDASHWQLARSGTNVSAITS